MAPGRSKDREDGCKKLPMWLSLAAVQQPRRWAVSPLEKPEEQRVEAVVVSDFEREREQPGCADRRETGRGSAGDLEVSKIGAAFSPRGSDGRQIWCGRRGLFRPDSKEVRDLGFAGNRDEGGGAGLGFHECVSPGEEGDRMSLYTAHAPDFGIYTNGPSSSKNGKTGPSFSKFSQTSSKLS